MNNTLKKTLRTCASLSQVLWAFLWWGCNVLPPLAMTEEQVHTSLADADGDRWRDCGSENTTDCDCDDARSDVHPKALEMCDHADNDCNGLADDGLVTSTFFPDRDGDGHGKADDAHPTIVDCQTHAGYSLIGDDCNDDSSARYPGNSEECDGLDNDCDELVDEGKTITSYPDLDLDLHGDAEGVTVSCEMPEGYVILGDDCNDSLGASYPGNAEICDTIDNDCNGLVDDGLVLTPWYPDVDQDGFGDQEASSNDIIVSCSQPAHYSPNQGDCDDGDDTRYPGAYEVCDSYIDHNCDGLTGGVDRDEDGHPPCTTDDRPPDCDDLDATSHPNGTEVCDGHDNDCNGKVDDVGDQTLYRDNDEDSWGSEEKGDIQVYHGCVREGWVLRGGDCNDNDLTRNPDQLELCNQLDDDCDGTVDDSLLTIVSYRDGDGDGYGSSPATGSCMVPAGYALWNGDCDDSNDQKHPGAVESCTDAIDLNCDDSVGDADVDGDGTQACEDCDDLDPKSYPSAHEMCDLKDNDCDSEIDNVESIAFYRDADHDGYGTGDAESFDTCTVTGWSTHTGDCSDDNPLVYPGASELCDGADNNCNGELADFELDRDLDGYRGCASSAIAADCDDAVTAIHPGAPESCNGLDDDCDEKVDDGVGGFWYPDADEDTFGVAEPITQSCVALPGHAARPGDCNDGDRWINPDAAEQCNQLDDDCDGSVDDNVATFLLYPDLDGDGYGDGSVPALNPPPCLILEGYAPNETDCNDSVPSIHPAGAEKCDGLDNDCDGLLDEDVKTTFYLDEDGDGAGGHSGQVDACQAPVGYAPSDNDCDDGDPSTSPAAPELCNRLDDDCDAAIDEGVPTEAFYRDADADGYGSATVVVQACAAPDGYLADASDCDDSNDTIRPGALEQCNNKDDDCDGVEDEAVVTQIWYVDADGDGFGSDSMVTENCAQPDGWLTVSGDCNDGDATVHPGADELQNGQDDNCDGYGDADIYVTVDGISPVPSIPAYSSVQAAIDAAMNEQLIELGAGTWKERIDLKGKALKLVGSQGAGQTILDGNGAGPVVTVSGGVQDARIRGLTIRGSKSVSTASACGSGVGGGVCVAGGSTLELREVVLEGNSATSGGNLAVTGSTVTLAQTLVTNGYATSGGGIYVTSKGTVTLDSDTEVRLNSTSGSGGGIYVASASAVSLSESLLSGNTASLDGGGIYVSGSSLTATGARLEVNNALKDGGGIRSVNTSTTQLTSCLFVGNVAVNGGGISSDGTTVLDMSLRGGELFSNSASGNGGGLDMKGGTVVDVTFLDNVAQKAGGGIYAAGGDISFSALRLEKNRAIISGGGASLAPSTQSILTSCTFSENIAASGGGLAISTFLKLESCDLVGNSAGKDVGGAVAKSGSGTLEFHHCRLLQNSAVLNGGGVNVSGGTLQMTNSIVASNRSFLSGGGLAITGTSSKYLLTSMAITGNVAEYQGGGLYLSATGGGTTQNTLFGWNVANYGENAYFETTSGVQYSAFYLGEMASAGVLNISEDTLIAFHNLIGEEPKLLNDPRTGRGSQDDDWHLRNDSPLVDVGNPATSANDPDGSRCDIGAFGGGGSLATDGDDDHLPDDWETAHGLGSSANDSAEDPDGDGLSNAEELEAATMPELADSDSDGLSDAVELSQGSDPLSAVSPGAHPDEPLTAYVPDDFSSIQAAIDEAVDGATVRIRPGTYDVNLVSAWKGVELESTDGSDVTILDGGNRARILASVGADGTVLRGLTFTGGTAQGNGGGGGVYFYGNESLLLEDVQFLDNTAYQGGGLISYYDTVLRDAVFRGNEAVASGGAIFAYGIDAQNTRFEANTAGTNGGAIFAKQRTVLSNCMFDSNLSAAGGAIYAEMGDNVDILSTRFSRNSKSAVCVGCSASAGTGIMNVAQSVFAFNTTTASGGGIYFDGNTLNVETSIFYANQDSGSVYGDNISGYGCFSAYSLFYLPSRSDDGTSCPTASSDVVGKDPLFLDPLNDDFHLQLTSPARDKGDLAAYDPDLTRSDMGAYGGPGADDFDLDGDSYYDYFWPGDRANAPQGYSPADWDLDDLDEEVH